MQLPSQFAETSCEILEESSAAFVGAAGAAASNSATAGPGRRTANGQFGKIVALRQTLSLGRGTAMSQMGQKAKYSLRANDFRFAPDSVEKVFFG
jgi:hypothetical protein